MDLAKLPLTSARRQDETPLQPYPITLSALHLDGEISAIQDMSGTEMLLPISNLNSPKRFKVIVQDSTSCCLILESFYRDYISGLTFDGKSYPKSSLATAGISRVAFTSSIGIMQDQDPLRDRTAPKFKVSGISRIPIHYQGYDFAPSCFILDHIFCRREFESQFVAVLGMDFLRESFLRAQWTERGYVLTMPPLAPISIRELVVNTDGCCLSNGQTEGNPARAGYGIHFPQLPRDWDIGNMLSLAEKHTSQRAEVIAVIRALQLLRARQISCKHITIYTDSMYAVQGLGEWIPKWRVNGYRNAQKKPVANADLFKVLDALASEFTANDVLLNVKHIPREENRIADGLAKAGAVGPPGSPGFDMKLLTGRAPGMLLGRPLFEKAKPLVQWTPDGLFWAKSSWSDICNEEFTMI